jgi:hypothetical protein
MAKKNHLERIKDLIKLNKSDLEIRVIIYNEYGIYYTLTDIQEKRSKRRIDFKIKLENSLSIKEELLITKSFDLEILIDNLTFKIYKKKEFFKPIFYYRFNSSNGDNEIIINLSHELYKPDYEAFIIKIACSMYFTRSTMTSNVIDIFINRLLSNLVLIHE